MISPAKPISEEPPNPLAGPLESFVSFQTSQGSELQATLLQVTRFQVVLETYSPASVLRASEVLNGFRIIAGSHPLYSGRAIVKSVVSTGNVTVCQATLEDSWLHPEAMLAALDGTALRAAFVDFLKQWQKICRILPEFKAAVADMQSFFTDLRLWLEQLELGIRSTPTGDRLQMALELISELGQETTPAIGDLFEKFESVAARLKNEPPEQEAAHSAFAKRLLHPLLLSSPFLYRTFRKPLGYAGDYEMVNMICRDPLEGSNLFAKLINLWFLRQPPAEAHRNRIQFLIEQITKATLQAARSQRTAKILSVGCGPALEVQRFLAASPLAGSAQFTLIDFNEETIQHVRSVLEGLTQRLSGGSHVRILRKSVTQLLKEASSATVRPLEAQYDLVYCAGLFDYLTNPICRRLSDLLYEWTAPGGTLITTNVDKSNPRRLTMEYIMDWHLIYRSGAELAALKPGALNGEELTVATDVTGINVHFSVVKHE